jgi:hypothetical protein
VAHKPRSTSNTNDKAQAAKRGRARRTVESQGAAGIENDGHDGWRGAVRDGEEGNEVEAASDVMTGTQRVF